MSKFNRITQTPSLMGGKACSRGMRVTVGMVVGAVAAGREMSPGREIDDLWMFILHSP